ncbi:MAG: hypothetical protein HYT78_04385 [Deltaproteobacteria bacterium]|nr:hypothetical protein [Deltaproteobacteria bacterium]
MADFVLTRGFLEELAGFEKSASAHDLENLEGTLAAIVQNPSLPGRVPSFYDPSLPSYLYRSGNLLIHYRVPRRGLVEFLNLFWPKV